MLGRGTRCSLFVVLFGSLVAACGGSSESDASSASNAPGASNESSEDALSTASGAHGYRFDDPEIGTWYFRFESSGKKLSGHFVVPMPEGMPRVERGTVEGTIASDGTQRMLWHMPGFGLGAAPPLAFEGKVVGTKLEGTFTVQGKPPRQVALTSIAPGTLQNGKPVAIEYAARKDGACTTDAYAFEVFGLANAGVEKTINDAVERATKKVVCSGTANYATGGTWLGVVRGDLISFTTGHDASDDANYYQYEYGERFTLRLDTGAPLSLYGDVVEPGHEAELAQALEQAIDALSAQSISAPEKTNMKSVMLSAAGKARLPKLFSLTERGISFAAEGCSAVKVHGVTVPYSAVTAILAQSGKAKSAWTP